MRIPKLEDYKLYFVKIKQTILEDGIISFRVIDIRTSRPQSSDYGLAFGYTINRWEELRKKRV